MVQAVQGLVSSLDIAKLDIKNPSKLTGSDTFTYALDAAKQLIEANKKSEIETKNLTNDFITGKTDDIASLLIAQEKSGILLQYTMQLRNGIMSSYKEIMTLAV